MLALNRNEIRKKSVRFWVLFATLVISTLIVIYFFVWSSHKESEDYIAQIVSNRSTMNKQIALQSKIDSLAALVGKLDYGEVEGYLFLKSYIRQQKESIKQLIGNDSATHFSGYARIVDQLDRQVMLRDTIHTLVNTAEDIRSSLERCKNSNKSMGKSLIIASHQ